MKKAFTLFEVLFVVILLGILAALVIPKFADASDDTKVSAQVSDLNTLRSQIQLYRVKEGVYPPNLGALEPTYIKSVLVLIDPVSGNPYVYTAATGTVSAP